MKVQYVSTALCATILQLVVLVVYIHSEMLCGSVFAKENGAFHCMQDEICELNAEICCDRGDCGS